MNKNLILVYKIKFNGTKSASRKPKEQKAAE